MGNFDLETQYFNETAEKIEGRRLHEGYHDSAAREVDWKRKSMVLNM